MPQALRLATRGSPLARWQANFVAARLKELTGRPAELVIVESVGDKRADVPIAALGERGVFTNEIDRAVAEGRADVAVHSAKDLPSASAAYDLVLACVPVRADARDALVGSRLEDLQPGATVASGSIRRRAQLAHLRPDLHFSELRGNIATRLSKLPEGGALVMALAALERLELLAHVAEVLDEEVMLPQVGQGAIALRCRDESDLLESLHEIDDAASHRELVAERAFLARLGGGCDAPVGARAHAGVDGEMAIEALIASRDGSVVVRRRGRGTLPELVGREIADALIAEDGVQPLLGGLT
jgi:hydroxymethylbilane synthase